MSTLDGDRAKTLRIAKGHAAHGFTNRAEAGKVLAARLAEYTNRLDVVVLALPRGGVPVAFEIAMALHAPLDIMVVKKIGVPGYEELALGAVASGGILLLDEELTHRAQINNQELAEIARAAFQEVERREDTYRNHRQPPLVEGRTIILVDDGLATGSSMHAAVEALRRKRPARIVVAVPVASQEAAVEAKRVADDFVCATIPDQFFAVGAWYDDFSQTEDGEVRHLLDKAAQRYLQT
jgi:putative phosphoribosyl transferase